VCVDRVCTFCYVYLVADDLAVHGPGGDSGRRRGRGKPLVRTAACTEIRIDRVYRVDRIERVDRVGCMLTVC